MMLSKKLWVIWFLVFSLFCTVSEAYYDTEGHSIELSTLKGKWVIVNYWADWCEGCVAEVPELNQFYKDNQDKKIVLYGVNYDQLPLADLKKAIKNSGIQFPNLTGDPEDMWGLGPIDIIPVTFIINPKGKVVKTIVGPSDEQSLIKSLHDLRA